MLSGIELDPFVLEITRNRLEAVVADMATTLIRTSGNSGATEGHDLSCAIYDEHGNGIAYSLYILIHVRSTKEGVLAIKRDFANDIHPGDVFLANDVYWGGGVHPGDVCVFKPIFVHDQLIGFAGTSCHLYDVGGMTPGSFAPQARDTYQESLNIPPVKIVRRGELDVSTWNLIMNNVRTPENNAMDIKALIAACNLAEKRMIEIVSAMGIEQYRSACSRLQDLSEAAIRARIAEIQDGVYEATDWLEHNGHANDLYRVHCKLTVSGDDMTFDFSESDPQTDGFINSAWCGLVGATMTIIMQMVGPDIPFNEGYVRPIRIVCPPGRIVHAQRPAPVGCGHIEAGPRVSSLVMAVLNRAMAASAPPMRDRVMGSWGDSWPCQYGAGINHYGKYDVYVVHDGSTAGGPALTGRDGISIAGLALQSFARLPDIEVTEKKFPLLLLSKRYFHDSAGPGEFRGGFSMEAHWMLHDVDNHQYTLLVGRRSVPLAGSFGGYPSSTSQWEVCHDGQPLAWAKEAGRMPSEWNDVGTWTSLPPKVDGLVMHTGSMLHYTNTGGGGLGDPLRRDPARVARDVRDGWCTVGQARYAYGVVVDAKGKIDAAATTAERAKQRQTRISESTGPADVRTVTGEPIDHRLTPDLEVVRHDGHLAVRCRHCQSHICDAPANWREHVRHREVVVDGPLFRQMGLRAARRSDVAFSVQEHICPGCSTLLDAQVAPSGSPAPFDSKPSFYMAG